MKYFWKPSSVTLSSKNDVCVRLNKTPNKHYLLIFRFYYKKIFFRFSLKTSFSCKRMIVKLANSATASMIYAIQALARLCKPQKINPSINKFRIILKKILKSLEIWVLIQLNLNTKTNNSNKLIKHMINNNNLIKNQN